MAQLFSNAARGELASAINDTDAALSIVTGGALFPVANTGAATIAPGPDWFKLVLQDNAGIEIIYVRTHTSGSAAFSDILRGQEGTTARGFATGSIVGLRQTAGDANAMAAKASLAANTFTAAQRGAFVELTDASTIALDLSLANQYNLIIGGNRILGMPTNVVVGQQGIINVYQGIAGSFSLAYAWIYGWAGGSASALSLPGCSRDMLAYSVDAYNSGTVTMTIATPGVATLAAHGFKSGHKCQLTTTGALPTGLAASTTYFLHVIDANTFHFCTTLANVAAGTYIATSGSQSGVHTLMGGVIALALAKAVI